MLHFVGCGHFIYYEASGQLEGDRAILSTKPFSPTQYKQCVRFFVSMYGGDYPKQMGSLTVYSLQAGGSVNQIFHHSGVTTTNDGEWREVNTNMYLLNGLNMFVVCYLFVCLFVCFLFACWLICLFVYLLVC